ncbi:MAG: glutamate--cysteine ligase [Haliea sp.]|nr:glutamate--cysteine ligase [Haliea sp.]
MSSHFQKQWQAVATPESLALLKNIQRGIEKESLRITPDGKLSQTPHPVGLGSALTHSSITTDYSEALLEFITPVNTDIEQSLLTLDNIHRFVYGQIGDEILWSASMPCIVPGDEGIPVARYGSSHVARMKTVYRYGLGHRYGRLMQTIAGIHYNFSMPHAWWEKAWEEDGRPGKLKHYISEHYLGLIRNFKRYSWLLIYLFGASPAVCASFLKGRDHHGLQPFDQQGRSLYMPHGTSLRMGDLGYNSNAQKNLNICYNSLDNYVETLHQAILQPHAGYRDIPSGENGDYQQLNDSLLQIENEFYSPIRPKRVTDSGETPLNALERGGIEYIEVRCVDVSPFHPLGLDGQQIRFLDTFLLHCLLQDSPPCDDEEQQHQAANLEAVVNRGREPGLRLRDDGGEKGLADWAGQLLDEMGDVAQLLDAAHASQDYIAALADQQAKVDDPEKTPSARILREMRERDLPFFHVAMGYSQEWAAYFAESPLPAETAAEFERESARSLQAQRDIEEGDDISFQQYLNNFFSQYEALQAG